MKGREEMERFSGCMDIIEGNGNIINKEFPLNITGKHVTNIEIESTDISCKKMWQYIHLPIHKSSVASANDICNKIEANSIGPKIENEQEYAEFYNAILKLPAYRSRCWHG